MESVGLPWVVNHPACGRSQPQGQGGCSQNLWGYDGIVKDCRQAGGSGGVKAEGHAEDTEHGFWSADLPRPWITPQPTRLHQPLSLQRSKEKLTGKKVEREARKGGKDRNVAREDENSSLHDFSVGCRFWVGQQEWVEVKQTELAQILQS